MTEIDTRSSTPYSNFKLDEATAQAATWTAIKADYIAMYDPQGTSNLVTAENSYETTAQAAWNTYVLALATADHNNQLDQANSQTTSDKAQSAATSQMTYDLSQVENNLQKGSRGLYAYTAQDRTDAGVDPASEDDAAIYEGAVKNAWLTRDSSQSTARLTHVTQLGNDYKAAEQGRAAATRIYQQAIRAAEQTLKDTQTALWATFAKLQTTTYQAEIAGWLTSPESPWHEKAATIAAAQSDRTDDEQDAKAIFETASNDAEFDYKFALEGYRETLRNDRAVASSAKSLVDQQHVEDGESYSE
ncbi:MAG: hypothetical protein JKY95_15530, partial [Planctomycetaceae bacterium]|nr:hypothetical protein [Planctomycetaceae bacterium]